MSLVLGLCFMSTFRWIYRKRVAALYMHIARSGFNCSAFNAVFSRELG